MRSFYEEKKQLSVLAAGLLVVSGLFADETVDPRFPAEWKMQQAERVSEWSRWTRTRIRELETEQNTLRETLSCLPQFAPRVPTSQFGYHSSFEAADTGDHWIRFSLRGIPRLISSIALVPAFDPLLPAAVPYAFPKRFKIEARESESAPFREVVNWMDEDFPDPGPYPVFFSNINEKAREILITVSKGKEEAASCFALGEVYIFHTWKKALRGDNIAIWAGAVKTVSDQFAVHPFWDLSYISDREAGFGFPISAQKDFGQDLFVVSDDYAGLSERVELTLDLKREVKIERIDIWPAESPEGLSIPWFGFPENVTLEIATDSGFEDVRKPQSGWDVYRGRHSQKYISLRARGARARYIRISLTGLQEFEGKRVLGLGEIRVSQLDQDLAIGCDVKATGIPGDDLDQLPRLVDGRCWGRRILPEAEWIEGLARRRPLTRRLEVVERELELARAQWQRIRFRFAIGSGVAVGGLFLFVFFLQRRHRRRLLTRQRERITRDLHDEVGSSLGGIALMAGELVKSDENSAVRDGLNDLSLMAREANVSLREVVWLNDRKMILLSELMEKVVERVERVLRGVELDIEIAEDLPPEPVSLSVKRHLMMFFREAIHNCYKHAEASRLQIRAVAEGNVLEIRLKDNGRGFDTSLPVKGWGLSNMKKRAQELGAEFSLQSQAGEGTTLSLRIPLARLSQDPKKGYQTSN